MAEKVNIMKKLEKDAKLYKLIPTGSIPEENISFYICEDFPGLSVKIWCDVTAQAYMMNVEYNGYGFYDLVCNFDKGEEESIFIKNVVEAFEHRIANDEFAKNIRDRAYGDFDSFRNLLSEKMEMYTPEWFLREKYANEASLS